MLVLAPPDVQEFIWLEAHLLNARRFEEWLELFTDNAIYWVPERPDQMDGENEPSLAYDDMGLLRARIQRLRHPHVYSQQPPSLGVRVVSNILSDPVRDAEISVHSTFVMIEYRKSEQRVFGGELEHRLRHCDARWRIARKTVRLVNAGYPFGNLGIPF
jgi:benzoate/toluate 1,2-dioxygenase beta subunit